MIVGFTGTQIGMTSAQRERVLELLAQKLAGLDAVVHGDCVGADEDFDRLARQLLIPRIVRPSNIEGKRAFCDGWGPPSATVHPPEHPLVRNAKIVEESNEMIATPKGPEIVRSGTWATVRLAKKADKQVTIVMPDGSVVVR